MILTGDDNEVAGLRSELEKLLALRLDEGKAGELLLAVGDQLVLAGGGDDVAVLQSEVSRLLSLAVGEHLEEGSGDEGELVLADPESLEWHLRMVRVRINILFSLFSQGSWTLIVYHFFPRIGYIKIQDI